ncbi:hypothetical protein, variant 2 [Aphanomyces astaci]|uniref:Uncharacterized protein n=1 Tax=Aphanomyces astaci TaxID=112090 RepID=W4GYF8_APHAT|nr:hypothetical protein, variant 2 [Aphanomyces astaci]ETV84760.1 hypothetical protein, variant 2 [Aphanomyces astaci]|eukprot:XP_009826452.1 hypothetical protein, variant 2 [Aphanomyces astaci]
MTDRGVPIHHRDNPYPEPDTPPPLTSGNEGPYVDDGNICATPKPRSSPYDYCPATPPSGPRTPLTPIASTPRPAQPRPSMRISTSTTSYSHQPSPAPPRILMMPRRSEPQVQLTYLILPQTRGRSSTSAFHLRRPGSIVDTRPRLAPLKSKARPSEKEKMETEVLPDYVVDHMFAMTPRSTSSSAAPGDDFIPSQSPIAVIEESSPASDEMKVETVLTTANHLGIAVFVDMMLKLVMFLVFMSYIDPIRMLFSIFGYSSSFSFSIRQYFLVRTSIIKIVYTLYNGYSYDIVNLKCIINRASTNDGGSSYNACC